MYLAGTYFFKVSNGKSRQKKPSRGVLTKNCLKIRSKSALMPNAISTKLSCDFVEISLQHGCSPVNLLQLY